MASTSGGGAKGLCQEGLAHAHRSDEEDVFFLLEELEGEEFVEVAAVGLDRSRPVEVLHGDAFIEARGEQPAFKGEVVAALHLVGEDEGEEGGIVELLGAGKGEPVGQCWHHLSQLEALEETKEVRFEAHPVASTRRC